MQARDEAAIGRRQIMAGGAALALGGVLGGCVDAGGRPTAAIPAPGDGLQAIAARRGRAFGTCLSSNPRGGSLANPAYRPLVTRECGIAVAENEMKWQALRPAPDRFAFARFDSILADAEAAGLRMRGHNLLWHYDKWFPAWLNSYDFGAQPRREAERVLATHIETVVRRYGTRIYSYDVVNEAVDPETGGLRQTSLSRAMGSAEAVLDHAFHTARAAAPHAELVYNDYMSWEAGNEAHRAGVLRLLEGFRARGTPVDALGVQSHIGVFAPVPSIEALVAQLTPAWRDFLDRVTGMGYRLVVTEFDVRDPGLPADVATRDRDVAAFARAYLDLMLSYPQLTDVLAWGLSDRWSWLQGFEPRKDGVPTRGCPYDAALQPKPLRGAIADALAAAPMRTGTARS